MTNGIFFSLPAHGHTNPSLPVVAELVRRGEQVQYCSTPEFKAVIEQAGAQFVPYPNVPQLAQVIAAAAVGNVIRVAHLQYQLKALLRPFADELLRCERPDYVLHDSYASWGAESALALGLPAISSVAFFGKAAEISAYLRQFPWATLHMLLRTSGDVLRYNVQVFFPRGLKTGNWQYISGIHTFGELNIFYTSAAFHPPLTKLAPERACFIGFPGGVRPPATDFTVTQLHHPLIYISLGTVNNAALPFYRMCLSSLAGHPAQVVMSIGSQIDPQALCPLPTNFIVRPYVPQLSILERADLFITHAGMNSAQEGLYYGVPMIAVPQQMEQGLVALRLSELNAGVLFKQGLLGRTPPGAALKQAVNHVLGTPAYKASAARLGKTLRQAGGAAKAADAILQYVRSTNLDGCKSTGV